MKTSDARQTYDCSVLDYFKSTRHMVDIGGVSRQYNRRYCTDRKAKTSSRERIDAIDIDGAGVSQPTLQRTISLDGKISRDKQRERTAEAVAKINGYLAGRQYSLAVSALADLLRMDVFDVSGSMQTPVAIRELFGLLGNKDGRLSRVCLEAIGRNSGILSLLTRTKMGLLVRELYCSHCYDSVVYLGERMTAGNIAAKSGRTVLMAIRKQQINAKNEAHSFGVLKSAQRRLDPSEYMDQRCPYRAAAEHVVLLLARGKQITAGHLGKQLEIDLASIDPKAILPHDMLLWLRGFCQYGVEPDINTMTVIINEYIRHGDSVFAVWIYEQMVRGVISATLQDYSIKTIAVPAPNTVTEALLADVWIKMGKLDPVFSLLSRLQQQNKQDVLQRLVTRTVSGLVDQGRTSEAEAVWQKYGMQGNDKRSSANIRALIKLSLGHIRSSDPEKAFALFQTACNSVSSADVSSGLVCMLHFSSLLNSLLRAFHQKPAFHPERTRACLAIARAHGIPFNTTTYNILLARLSRIARAAYASKRASELKAAAGTMQRLYAHMVCHDVGIDDMTLCHLAPLWIHLGLEELLRSNLDRIIQGRSRGKVEQLRRHLLHHVKHWGLEEKATGLGLFL